MGAEGCQSTFDCICDLCYQQPLCVLRAEKKVEHHGLGRSVKPFCHKTAKELFPKFHCLRQVKQMMELWLGSEWVQQIEELCMHPEQSS